jgi:type VI protein secretion system component VasK
MGPWAWFRLLDAAASLRADSDVRFTVSFQAGGHQGAVIIEPTSIRNPYQQAGLVHQFKCGS